ncbi:MAG TPA: inositol monophosphatase family protein [Gemmatimonadales bacterium]|nr:inositol monophosphatase family protein [Gemmatimonadales bacterium]
MNLEARQLLAAAQLAADRAAAFLRREEGRRGPAEWAEKGRADFVTEVDREAERLIAETLTRAFPGGVIVGEELTPAAAGAGAAQMPPGLAWVVDPLDGTTNFLHRFPFYAVSIGALVDRQPVAAVVHHVVPRIRYHATKGGGAWQGETRLHVSAVTEPRQALIGTGFPYRFMDQWPQYREQFGAVIANAGGVRRPGSAALDLCDVAAGRFDGFWELSLAPWDVAAGTLIVREAGGSVTGLAGEQDVVRQGPIVAGNPTIHAWLLKLLNDPDASPLT